MTELCPHYMSCSSVHATVGFIREKGTSWEGNRGPKAPAGMGKRGHLPPPLPALEM